MVIITNHKSSQRLNQAFYQAHELTLGEYENNVDHLIEVEMKREEKTAEAAQISNEYVARMTNPLG